MLIVQLEDEFLLHVYMSVRPKVGSECVLHASPPPALTWKLKQQKCSRRKKEEEEAAAKQDKEKVTVSDPDRDPAKRHTVRYRSQTSGLNNLA